MTDKEKEIKIAEREALAEVRKWKAKVSKKLAAMAPGEITAYYKEFRKKRLAEEKAAKSLQQRKK